MFSFQIRINGDIIGTFESYSGSTFNSFNIEEIDVESVTMESVGIDVAEWIALLEVGDTSNKRRHTLPWGRAYTRHTVVWLELLKTASTIAPPTPDQRFLFNERFMAARSEGRCHEKMQYFYIIISFLLQRKECSNDDVGGARKGRRISGHTAGRWLQNRRFR